MASEPFESDRQISALEKFATNNPDLEEMGRQAKEFDALSFLGLSGLEKTHSDILAWLLNPRENHGAGDCFLKHFLAETGVLTPEEIRSYDWSGTTVRREWANEVEAGPGSLDILVLNQQANFVCAIENKTFSGEHDDQLTRYRKALKARYPGFHKKHLFLSPNGTLPASAEDQASWKPVDYGKVLNSVEATLKEGGAEETTAVAAFLHQYTTTLRRNIVPDTSVQQAATRIYLKHREAIDLIFKYQEAYIEDLEQFCREAIRQAGWVPNGPQDDTDPKKLVGFFPNDWKRFDSFRAGRGWNRVSNTALRFHFDLRGTGRVNLILTIPPGDRDDSTRRALFDMAQQHDDVFNPRGDSLGGRYTTSWIRLHASEPILSEEELVNWNREVASQKILAWVVKFAAEEFPAMNDAIRNCFERVDENRK